MSPDAYTTTADPLRPMICANCRGHFAGDSGNIVSTQQGQIRLCSNCLRDLGATDA